MSDDHSLEDNKPDNELEDDSLSTAKPKGKRALLLIIIALLILIAIPVGLYLSGGIPGMEKKAEEHHTEEAAPKEDAKPLPPAFLELQEFLVNLDSGTRQPSFLKMTVTLELASEEDKVAIEPYVPRIRDAFQVYLRELRAEDLRGSAAIYRLREELLLRVTQSVYPLQVKDILFKEILVQ